MIYAIAGRVRRVTGVKAMWPRDDGVLAGARGLLVL
jgi:hypothetical protein